jgi:uncharacterized membrane protein
MLPSCVHTGPVRKLSQRKTLLSLLAIGGIASLALALRLLHLGSKSLWVDECASLDFAQQPWPEFWKTIWNGEANMLTYYLLLRAWIHLGNGEFVVRMLSLIPAVATVWVIYLLGKRLFSTRVGLVSALLLAVNACHVAYSQEARSYTLLLFFSTLSLLGLVNAIESSSTRNWVFYSLASVAAVYSHFFAGLLILAEWVSLAFLPRPVLDLKKFTRSALFIAVAVTPVLWFIVRRDVGQIDFIPNPGIMDLYRLLLFLTSYGGKVFGVLVAIIYLAAAGVGLRILASRWRLSWRSLETWRPALLASCLLLPVLLDVSVSHFGKQVFNYRYLLICLPALTVLTAFGLSQLSSQRALTASLAAVVVLSMATVWRYYAKPKENWRGATQYVLSNSRPNDTLISYPWYAQHPIRYYQAQLQPPANALRVVPAQFYSPAAVSRTEIVWLLSCREDVYLRLFRNNLSQAYRFHQQWRYDGAILLEEYSNQELAGRHRPDLNSVARSMSPLVQRND